MKSEESVRMPGVGARYLRWALGLIIASFVLSNLVAIYEMRKTQADVQRIAARTFSSIDLVSSLSRNLYRKRILVQNHILETKPEAKSEIEREITVVDARIAELLRAYEPIAGSEGESAEVRELRSHLTTIQPEVERVIDLSRKEMDAEARAAVSKKLEPSLETINEAMDRLVRIERTRADEEVSKIRSLQQGAVVALSTLAIGGTTLALLAAMWATRLVRQRESQMREVAAFLEERNRELDAFAGRVAHDLRGPLTSINLAAALMARDAPVEDRGPAVLRRGVEQMEAIIQNLLTLSRISTQPMSATCETAQVAASVEEDIRPRVEETGGIFRLSVTPATVICSEGLLRQALWNLAENSVKFRRPEVPLEVDIRGYFGPHGYEFIVSDNGAGMSLRETRQAFEPFFRGERAHSIPGAGLGLSIVQRVIEASGGSVSVESTVGEGTTFKIQLPLAVSKAA